jgi:hypothetical protein
MKIQSLVMIAVTCAAAGMVAGCGDGDSMVDAPTVVDPAPVAPHPPPAPPAPPAQTPAPPPCDGCEPPVTNTNPPVRLTIRIYKVQDADGAIVPGIPSSIPIGYTVTIDATPKDANNKDTLGSGTVEFILSQDDLVETSGNHGFQEKMKVLREGQIEVKAFLDGIESNTLVITLG